MYHIDCLVTTHKVGTITYYSYLIIWVWKNIFCLFAYSIQMKITHLFIAYIRIIFRYTRPIYKEKILIEITHGNSRSNFEKDVNRRILLGHWAAFGKLCNVSSSKNAVRHRLVGPIDIGEPRGKNGSHAPKSAVWADPTPGGRTHDRGVWRSFQGALYESPTDE